MKLLLLSAGLVLTMPNPQRKNWGFFAHKKINEMAVFTLPPPMFAFFKKHLDYISAHAVDPDKRRYSDSLEAPRHFLDADHYERLLPLDTIPHRWEDALKKFGADTLRAYGIVPWHIEVMVRRLIRAFSEKDGRAIKRIAAELGHYVGDCHVPLHSTENHNGQLTDQHGIHAFWESRLPELYSESYDFFTAKAVYIADVNTAVWHAFEESHSALDSVLRLEKLVNSRFRESEKYTFTQRGNVLVKDYSEAYSLAYHELLNEMVERRMRAAIYLTGSLWYTAWVNAGQPELPDATESAEDAVNTDSLDIKYRNGSIIGRPEGHHEEPR